jgi:hypothetical protein
MGFSGSAWFALISTFNQPIPLLDVEEEGSTLVFKWCTPSCASSKSYCFMMPLPEVVGFLSYRMNVWRVHFLPHTSHLFLGFALRAPSVGEVSGSNQGLYSWSLERTVRAPCELQSPICGGNTVTFIRPQGQDTRGSGECKSILW